ncbi:hypothetical protein Tsubulata_042706, partial [Turnera subulata]
SERVRERGTVCKKKNLTSLTRVAQEFPPKVQQTFLFSSQIHFFSFLFLSSSTPSSSVAERKTEPIAKTPQHTQKWLSSSTLSLSNPKSSLLLLSQASIRSPKKICMAYTLNSRSKEVESVKKTFIPLQELHVQVTHSMPPQKIEIFKSLEDWAEQNILVHLKPVEKCWQPQDFLPDPASDGFEEQVRELRERAKEIPDDYYVVLVGDMITEEALPTYQTMLNTLDGVRDETGARPTSWAIWTRAWTAEENRHGDLLNKYLYLSGHVDMRQIEKTIRYLIGSGMDPRTENRPYLGFIYTSFQERATFISHGNTARHAKEYGEFMNSCCTGAQAIFVYLLASTCMTIGNVVLTEGLEVESRILKALQPQLCLDPCPNWIGSVITQFPPGKRLRQTPEVTVTSNNRIHEKKVCIDGVPERSNSRFEDIGIISGNAMPQHVQENLSVQNLSPNTMLALRGRNFPSDGNVSALPLISPQTRYTTGAGTPRSVQAQALGGLSNMSGASPSGQDMAIAYGDTANTSTSLHGKREHQDGQMSPLSNFSKRARLPSVGPDGTPLQQIGSHVNILHASDIGWKNSLMQQRAMTRGIQYGNPGLQKYAPQMFEGLINQISRATSFYAGQPGMRIGPKEEPFEMEKLDSRNLGQTLAIWTGIIHGYHKDYHPISGDLLLLREGGTAPERKISTKSAGALAQSPLSSKSGELSSGSAGLTLEQVCTWIVTEGEVAVPAAGGTSSLTSSANDSLQCQHQAQAGTKRRTTSHPKTPVMSNVGSPASVSNISVPLNANSPSMGTPTVADQTMLERFSKIEGMTVRHNLNRKKNKVDDWPVRKPSSYSPQKLSACLPSIPNNDNPTRQLSKSLLGGNTNVSKMRVTNFVLADRSTKCFWNPPNNPGMEVQQYDETIPGLTSNDVKPTLSGNASQNLLAKAATSWKSSGITDVPRALARGLCSCKATNGPPTIAPATSTAAAASSTAASKSAFPDSSTAITVPEVTDGASIESALPFECNWQNSSMQLGNHMVNKPSALQLQLLQQQQQQHQHQQLQPPPNQQQRGQTARSGSDGSIDTDEGLYEQPETRRLSAHMERIFWQKRLRLHDQQQEWQVVVVSG